MRPRLPPILAAACLFVLLVAPAGGRAEVAYRLIVEGAPSSALADLMRDVSDLGRLQDRPAETLAVLRRRADEDVEAIARALHAEGYYGARLAMAVRPPEQSDGITTVAVLVEPGPAFVLADVTIELTDAVAVDGFQPSYRDLGVVPGERARAEPILQAGDRMVARLGQLGHPGARLLHREVVVDHATASVAVRLEIAAGPAVTFGPTEVRGLSRVEPGAVERHVAWREGDRFDSRLVRRTRRSLLSTGLFDSVVLTRGDPDPAGATPMRLELTESARRLAGAGLKYGTDQGLGANVYWEHHNLLGDGERLRLEVTAAERLRSGAATLRLPAFLRDDQTLALTGIVSSEQQDAYDVDKLALGASVERQLTPALSASIGSTFERSFVTDSGQAQDFTLFGFPLGLGWDTADDPLDPRGGVRASLLGTPYSDFADDGNQFGILKATASWYLAFDAARDWVLATRAEAGTVVGQPRSGVPPDKRFYAGGGNSIRGYAYQLVGPLDADNTPTGGGSLLTAGVELRVRLSEDFGGVAFLDGGNVYEGHVPRPGAELLYGAGVGVRYYTPIGPLRFDIAMPLERRDVDDAFQIYLSLGQAF